MRKMLACILLCALVLSLSGCGGNAENAAVIDMTSEIYTQEDYLAAVQAVKTGFRDFQPSSIAQRFITLATTFATSISSGAPLCRVFFRLL